MPRKPPQEVVVAAGREVAISNPDKVLFPDAGYTKLDLVRYYLAVADGALRAAGGRPNVLVRYPNGIKGEFFYQKRAPDSRPPWTEVVSLRFPSGRTAEEVVVDDAAGLANADVASDLLTSGGRQCAEVLLDERPHRRHVDRADESEGEVARIGKAVAIELE